MDRRWAILTVAAFFTPGCAYFQDRGNDLLDVVWADVGIAYGVGVDFQATDAVHSGLGIDVAIKVGLERRRVWRRLEWGGAYVVGQHPPHRRLTPADNRPNRGSRPTI